MDTQYVSRTEIMDTDDLSEEAYEILLRAHQLNDFLWAELGASSRNYQNEEDYLNGMLKFIKNIKEKPEWYQDMWLMDEKMDHASLLHIEKHIKKVQSIPFQKRKFPKY